MDSPDKILDDLTDPSISLSSLLLRAKRIAPNLGNSELSSFIEHELEGYPRGDETLPPYRRSGCVSVGTLAGPFGSQIKGLRIPASSLPDTIRDFATHTYLAESIPALETHLQSTQEEFTISWPGDFVAAVADNIVQGYALVFASKPVSKGALRAVVDACRSTLLSRLLQLAPHQATPESTISAGGAAPELAANALPQPRVFISHSSRDTELAELLVQLLRVSLNIHAYEIRCTSVEGHRLPGGADTADQLRDELVQCPVFIGLLSEASLDSAYVLFELGARWGSAKQLIPLLAPSASSDMIRGPLSATNALNCTSIPQLHQLVTDVARSLGISPEIPSSYYHNIELILKYADRKTTATDLQSSGTTVGKDEPPISSWSPKYGLLTRILDTFNASSTLSLDDLVHFIQLEHPDYTVPNIFQMREMLLAHGYLDPVDRFTYRPGGSIKHLFDWIYD